ncbi:hypothetical protein ElyMa_006349900 [Elysia marginata]|uniref:Uncharacterized protein n=1 Tax=Elysia marginata TaxID=1093978 RepID=A0AAV4HPC8_9GAST|nr:hypothetical protein ElyMa_006349900 [Elysia marginata]
MPPCFVPYRSPLPPTSLFDQPSHGLHFMLRHETTVYLQRLPGRTARRRDCGIPHTRTVASTSTGASILLISNPDRRALLVRLEQTEQRESAGLD